MKLTKTSVLSILLLSSVTGFAADKYVPGTYEIDGMHSKIGFEIPHLVVSSVDGKFKEYQGKIELDEKFEKSKVEATIEVKSIDTGVSKRDEHLKNADFFDVKKFPTMTFKSTAIEGTPESFKLTGDLTMHGVTKPVTFDAKYTGSVKDGYGNQKAMFSAKALIKRKEFGLTMSPMVEAGPAIGDEVTLDFKIQSAKVEPKKVEEKKAEAKKPEVKKHGKK